MKAPSFLSIPLFFLLACSAMGQQPSKPATPALAPAKQPGAKPQSPSPAPNAQDEKAPPSVPELLAQGKSLYRAAKYKPALAKFEEVLKQEPEHDEALGLAAVTAFRLDSQSQSRDYFLRRAELPKQKDTVKSYSYYRAALSHWRQVHDIVAKFCEPIENRFVAKIPDRHELDVKYGIENGLEYADRALRITKNYAEAYNVINLLHSEAAMVAADEKTAEEHNRKAASALRRAIELSKPAALSTSKDNADFNAPTIRIAEYATRKEDEGKTADPMVKLIEGGKPIKRVQPGFPSIRAPKGADPNDPGVSGVTADGGAYSLGAGRGALTAAYAPGKVKVEVLVAADGSVAFTRIVDGRSDLRGAAILAARSWKFDPAKLDGKPVQVSGVITFNMRPPASRQ